MDSNEFGAIATTYTQQNTMLDGLLRPIGPPKYRCQVHGPIHSRKVIGDSYFCSQCLGEWLTREMGLEAPEVLEGRLCTPAAVTCPYGC